MDPERFPRYRIHDVWSAISGWSNDMVFDLGVRRHLTAITCEVINKSMGGKGVYDDIAKSMRLPNETTVAEMTPEQRSAMIRRGAEALKEYEERKRKEKELKKLNA